MLAARPFGERIDFCEHGIPRARIEGGGEGGAPVDMLGDDILHFADACPV